MSVSIALMAAAALFAQDGGHDWRALDQGSGRMMGIDTKSIVEVGDKTHMTAVAVWSEPQDGMTYSTAVWEFDCAAHRFRVASAEDYAADGTHLGSHEALEWGTVQQNTMSRLFEVAACQREWPQGTPSNADLGAFAAGMRQRLLQ